MIDGYVLRALHLTGAGVGAGTESELIHLGYHSLCTPCGLYPTLWKKSEGRNPGSHKKHGGTVLAVYSSGTVADAGSSMHRLVGILLRDRNGICVRNTAGAY